MRDPYEVLNISRDATGEEIDRAFQVLKERYHPSNYDDSSLREIAAEKYREVENAYYALSGARKSSDTDYRSSDNRQNDGSKGPFGYQDVFRQWQQRSGGGWAQGQAPNQSGQGNYGYNQHGQGYGYRGPYYRSSCCTGGCGDLLCAYCLVDTCCDCICGSAGSFC